MILPLKKLLSLKMCNFWKTFHLIASPIPLPLSSAPARVVKTFDVRDVGRPGHRTSSRRRGRPLKSGLRELYPRVKARASSEWGRFRVSVLQMAIPTGGNVLARPPRHLLAVRPAIGIADRSVDGCVFRAVVRRPSTGPTTQRTASSIPRPFAEPSTTWTASSLIPSLGSPPPPPPTVLSTVEFQVSIKRAAQTSSICFRTYVSQEL